MQPNEELSTFVFRQNQIVKSTNSVHYTRLMPRRNKTKAGRLETSICRSAILNSAEVWRICAEHFDRNAPKAAIGRGVGKASSVIDVELGFDADGTPYPEHANIVGWHDEVGKPEEELKNFWMRKAQVIASKFTYEPRA